MQSSFRRALLLAAALLTAVPAGAQGGSAPVIAGRAVAAESGAALSGVAVTARRERDTVVVARGVSGTDGRFRLGGVAPGRYVVRATLAGRQPLIAPPVAVAAGAVADVGDLRLATQTVMLEGLEVRAERPPVVHAEDRTIYSVKDMPTAIGGAADVMRTLPELEIDLDGNIRMAGNRPVTVHINGRPSPLKGEALTEFVRNLPADRIDRIEVVPNPSVRYEGGEAAIVNIVLRRGVELGLSGSVSLNATTRGGNGVSGQLAYQRGRLTLFGGASSRLHQFDSESQELRQNLRATPVTYLEVDQHDDGSNAHGSADLTAELEVGPKETLWGSASAYRGGWGGDNVSLNRILDADLLPTRVFDRRSDSESSFLHSDLALGFRRIMQPQRHEWSAELRRSGFNSDRDGRIEETTQMRVAEGPEPLSTLRLTGGSQDEATLIAKADLQRPLPRGGKMEVGVRSSREATDDWSDVRVFPALDESGTPLSSSTQAYGVRDREHSAYVNLSHKVGRLSLQGGLRAEKSSLALEPRGDEPGFDYDHFTVFPSANLNFQIREGRDLRLTYSKRVRRPWIWYLNPYVIQTDPLNVRMGNPDLEPAETHSLGMDLSWRARLVTLRLAPYFRRTNGEIEYIRTVDAAGVSTGMPRNLATIETYGSTLNASLRPTGWGTASATVGWSHDRRDAGALGAAYSRSGSTQFLSANTQVKAGRGVNLQASMRLNSPRETAQGRHSSTVWTEVGMRKQLFREKASLNVRMVDPFDVYRSTFVSRDPTFASVGGSRSSWGGRSVTASFTLRFGKAPQRKSTQGDGPATGGGPP